MQFVVDDVFPSLAIACVVYDYKSGQYIQYEIVSNQYITHDNYLYQYSYVSLTDFSPSRQSEAMTPIPRARPHWLDDITIFTAFLSHNVWWWRWWPMKAYESTVCAIPV